MAPQQQQNGPPIDPQPTPIVITIYPDSPLYQWRPTGSMHHREPVQTATTTVTDSTINTPLADTMSPIPKKDDTPNPAPPPGGPPRGAYTAAGVVVSVVGMMVLVGLLIFICKRSKRKAARAKNRRDTMDEQMIGTTSSESIVSIRPYSRPEPLDLPSLGYHSSSSSSITHHSPSSPSHPSILSVPSPIAQPAPVILSDTVNHSYLTGIDTSDHISISDQSNPQTVSSVQEDLDEPPPPYRPRSMLPISRHSSIHMANGMLPNYRPGQMIIPVTEESSINPFEDPEEDACPPPPWESEYCTDSRMSCAAENSRASFAVENSRTSHLGGSSNNNNHRLSSASEEDLEAQEATTTYTTL